MQQYSYTVVRVPNSDPEESPLSQWNPISLLLLRQYTPIRFVFLSSLLSSLRCCLYQINLFLRTHTNLLLHPCFIPFSFELRSNTHENLRYVSWTLFIEKYTSKEETSIMKLYLRSFEKSEFLYNFWLSCL